MQIVSTLCDRCYENDEQVPSDATTLIEINGRGTEIDLCTKHGEELTDLLAPFYEMGRRPDRLTIKPVKPSKATSGAFGCAKCPRSFATSQGLAMHRTRAHSEHGNQDDIPLTIDIDREVPGETSLQRKRRRDRERYAVKRQQERLAKEKAGV